MSPTLAPPQPVKDRQRRARLTPEDHETQGQFLDRCMRTLPGDTDSKNQYALQEWEKSGRETGLKRIAARKFPPDKFRRVENRPVFVEHTKTRTVTDPDTGEQREVLEKYDRSALEEIIDRCNERILDTGDFSPITAGHTPDQDALDKGAKMPEVLGYSGPYRLGVVGNVKPRYAIFCDEYHHVEDVDRLSRLQRRSPEVWMEERMRDRFFDPIAALGAETPRLDMGLTQFSRTADGRIVEKYSSAAVAPSGSNTFIPSDGGERRREDYQAGDQLMLAPEDIKQIVEAIEQLDWVQQVKQQMAPEVSATDPETGVPDAATPPPSATPPEVDQNQHYECDDDDHDMFSRYMAGDMQDEEAMEYMAGKRGRYQAQAEEGSAQAPDPGDPTGDASVGDHAVTEYRRNPDQKDRGGKVDYAAKYARLEREHNALKARVDLSDAKNREKYRRARLNERRMEGFAFDPDLEFEETKEFTDDQFDRHVSVTIEKYEKAPLDTPQLYTPDIAPPRGKSDKYERERSDKIRTHVLRERQKGNEIDWDEAAEIIDQKIA